MLIPYQRSGAQCSHLHHTGIGRSAISGTDTGQYYDDIEQAQIRLTLRA